MIFQKHQYHTLQLLSTSTPALLSYTPVHLRSLHLSCLFCNPLQNAFPCACRRLPGFQLSQLGLVSLTSRCRLSRRRKGFLTNVNRSRYTWSTEEGSKCSKAEKKTILAETAIAHEIATYLETHSDAQSSSYLHAFFPTGANYAAAVKTVYKNLADVTDQSASSGYIVDVTCATTKKCNAGTGYILHMDDIYTKGNAGKAVATMNFCPGETKFFNTLTTGTGSIIGTKQRLAELSAGAAATGADALKLAHRSRAVALIHELTHTNYVTAAAVDVSPEPYATRYDMAKDFAYGVSDCLALARGAFDRTPAKVPKYVSAKSSVYCGKKGAAVGGVCPAAVAMINADSYGFLAAGVWFSHKTGKVLPVPACAAATSKRFGSTLQARAASCGTLDAVDIIDLPTDQGAKVAASAV